MSLRIDGLVLVGLGFVGFMALNVLHDQGLIGVSQPEGLVTRQEENVQAQSTDNTYSREELAGATDLDLAESIPGYDPDAIIAPYESYMVTQGPHGEDYGHMAVDLSAGKGVTIRSPIYGVVTNLYIDEWGNPSLVLENERYLIELLHGHYTVKIGDRVSLGQAIGLESNLGNIADLNGRPCQQMECGYHTHINVYDKQLGRNVNPLELFGAGGGIQ